MNRRRPDARLTRALSAVDKPRIVSVSARASSRDSPVPAFELFPCMVQPLRCVDDGGVAKKCRRTAVRDGVGLTGLPLCIAERRTEPVCLRSAESGE